MRKRILKKIFRNRIFVLATAHIYVLYLFFVYYTCRKTYEGYDNLMNIWEQDNGVILCFWHNRLMLSPYIKKPKGRKSCAFISPHSDGTYSTVMTKYLDATPIYGSTNKSPRKALKEALRYLKGGYLLFMTPDGPRGPAKIAAAGAVQMSYLGNSWLLPITYSASRKVVLNSWDKLILPLPFGRLHFVFAPAFKKTQFADSESCRLHLQAQLNAITEIADKKCDS